MSFRLDLVNMVNDKNDDQDFYNRLCVVVVQLSVCYVSFKTMKSERGGVLSNCIVISVMKIDGTLIELAKPSTIRVVQGTVQGQYVLNDGIL